MRARPALTLATALVVLAPAACSAGGSDAATSSAAAPTTVGPTATATPSPSPTRPSAPTGVVAPSADPQMKAVLDKLYRGHDGVRLAVKAGVWRGERVAVASGGGDVTLLVAPARSTAWRVVGGWWRTLKRPTQLGKGPRFVLALGSDSRSAKMAGSRSDTLQVVGLDLRGGGGIVGIARDTWTRMPNGSSAKINAAYQMAGGPGAVSTVKHVTGLPVEGYVITGFGGFVKIVDAWGGIPIRLAKPIKGSATKINLSAGFHTLTGRQALQFARERKALPDGDFGRSRHQGDLLLAVAIKARLAGVLSVPQNLTIISAHSESNLTATQALTFAAALYRLDPRLVGRGVAKGPSVMRSGQSIVLLDAASKALFTRFRDGRL